MAHRHGEVRMLSIRLPGGFLHLNLMAGGMAAPDTFDPKRYFPFEKGLEVEKILSTFPAIDTNVDGLQIAKDWKILPK